MKIRIQKRKKNARIPTRGSAQAAGCDLYACLEQEVVIPPHESAMIGTGLSVEIPDGYFGGIFARSGLSAKEGLRPANCVGVVDSDYRGEVLVALHNDSDTERKVEDGERIAQLLILPYICPEFEETESLRETARGEGGFGSSGA